MAPTAVVFDVGNVLYGWDPDSFLARQIADALDQGKETALAGGGLVRHGRPYNNAALGGGLLNLKRLRKPALAD